MLYKPIKPKNITKYEYIGDIKFVTEDANLKIAPVNSGVILDFINSGIIFGTNNVHFVDSDGTKILEIATPTNESNISITNEGYIK